MFNMNFFPSSIHDKSPFKVAVLESYMLISDLVYFRNNDDNRLLFSYHLMGLYWHSLSLSHFLIRKFCPPWSVRFKVYQVH